MPIPSPIEDLAVEDLDAILARATRILQTPSSATETDACVLARIAVDFVALTKNYRELDESKTQTIDRCNALLLENRRLKRVTFDPVDARTLASQLTAWSLEVERQFPNDEGEPT